MSNSRSVLERARPLIGMLALGLALAFGPVAAGPALAQTSPQDRARFVSITRMLEQAPVQPRGQPDRDWALQWLTEAPDVSVTICESSVGGLDDGYSYSAEVLLQYMFAMGAHVIEHPEAANDENAKQLAGVTGALKAYRAILRTNPGARSPNLDALLETEARGGLQDFIRSNAASCSA